MVISQREGEGDNEAAAEHEAGSYDAHSDDTLGANGLARADHDRLAVPRSIDPTLMLRKPDPERIYLARRAAMFRRLADHEHLGEMGAERRRSR
jgi:hypothetical protein